MCFPPRSRLRLAFVVLVSLGAGLAGPMRAGPTNAAAAASESNLGDFIRRFRSDWNGVRQFYDLPWSATEFDRHDRLYRDWQQRLAALDFDPLGQPGRIDYLLLRNKLTAELGEVSLQRSRLGEMELLLPFRQAIQELEQTRWRMQGLDPRAGAAAVAEIPDQIKQLRKRLEAGKKEKEDKAPSKTDKDTKPAESPLRISPLLAKRAAAAVNDLRRTLKTWFSFYDGYQPDFAWWVKKPHDEAASALEDYAKFLREEIAGLKGKDEDPLLGEAIGREKLLEDLATEVIAYTPEELIAIGERELAWGEAEMKKAARELGFDNWKDGLAKVKSQFVPPGQQDELVAEFGREAIAFLKERELLTIPPLAEELWRVSMISPEGQKTLPYAAYGGQSMMVAYAKDEMKHEDKLMSMRGNNRHFTRIVTAHELIPGHHLQAFMSDRHHPYRLYFSTPFYVEGWALYWEMRLWDLGYGRTPADRIGMLFWRMHRAARIIVSLKFHLGQMKPAEMVEFLIDRCGHERLGATSEVRRYIGDGYSPLYQCGYMIGGLQLRALHRELVGAGRMTDKQFNDTVLTYGPIPIELVRAGMLNLPLTPDYHAGWKFAAESLARD